MKIEVGKYYRTRDGRKAYVGYRHPEIAKTKYVLVGHVVADNRSLLTFKWLACGQWRVCGESDSDLVAEWIEPTKHYVKVYLFRTGSAMSVSLYDPNNIAIASKIIEFTEGVFE